MPDNRSRLRGIGIFYLTKEIPKRAGKNYQQCAILDGALPDNPRELRINEKNVKATLFTKQRDPEGWLRTKIRARCASEKETDKECRGL